MRTALRSFAYSVPALLAACTRSDQAIPAFAPDDEIAAWVEMWNTYDLDRVGDLFLNDDRVTYLSSEREGLIAGPPAVLQHHAGFGFVTGGREPTRELWVEDVRSDVFGPTVVISAVWYFGDRAAPGDSVQHGPMTAVYTWAGEEYRIAHMHFGNY